LTLKPTSRIADTPVMTHFDPDPAGDGEREALATLIARFQADRDMLAAGAQRAEAMVRDLASRLEALAARTGAGAPAAELAALRSEMRQLASTVAPLHGEVARTAEALAQLRDQLTRRAEETEARLGIRLDAIVAGVDAEARVQRDALRDRATGIERRLQDAEATVAARLASLEQREATRGGSGGMLECVRDEVIAVVMMVVSIGAVVGRLTLSLVR